MDLTLKTPGVYVDEISAFPSSIVPVSTSIPAFVGVTSQAIDGSGNNLQNIPTRISSMLEYQTFFGGGPALDYAVTATKTTSGSTTSYTIVDIDSSGDGSLLYYAIRHYFLNGGGPCYIVATRAVSQTALKAGLDALEAEDEPTLLVIPDAVSLESDGYQTICQQMLAQCGLLKDRFAILDVQNGDTSGFRDAVSGNLSYGSAYTPYLMTSIQEVDATELDTDGVSITLSNTDQSGYSWEQTGCIEISYNGTAGVPTVVISGGTPNDAVSFSIEGTTLTITNIHKTLGDSDKLTRSYTGNQILEFWESWTGEHENFSLAVSGNGRKSIQSTEGAPMIATALTRSLSDYQSIDNQFYNQVLNAITSRTVTLPPSAAIAGCYCQTDSQYGVWKAPANRSLQSVIAPTTKITNADQEDLNVPTNGKSINAIRSFTGQGTLVWGARTLLGNDENWRYISVRRLFIFMEESIQQSTSWAVFEPNVKVTWLKVQASIENFLYGLWQQGGLAGSTPQEAYFVAVGLGTTMTAEDVLNGKMNITVGAAPSRPAEFITITFTQLLQQA